MEIEIISAGESHPQSIKHQKSRKFYELTQKDKSASSRRTYRYGWEYFQNWCLQHEHNIDKESPSLLVGYFLADIEEKRSLSPRSVTTYLAAIRCYLLEKRGYVLDHPSIRRAMKGLRNSMRDVRKVKKSAILVEDLQKMLEPLNLSDKTVDIRDKAILLVGFKGALRRSELSRIEVEHIRFDNEGMTILLPHSKTDQEGSGQYVQIPYSRPDSCAVLALRAWLERGGIKSGPVFRAINKHGSIQSKAMTDKSVALIIKKLSKGHFDLGSVAGHSLRRGFVTSTLEAGADSLLVMRQTRHKSVNMLLEYRQDIRDYKNNALRSLNF